MSKLEVPCCESFSSTQHRGLHGLQWHSCNLAGFVQHRAARHNPLRSCLASRGVVCSPNFDCLKPTSSVLSAIESAGPGRLRAASRDPTGTIETDGHAVRRIFISETPRLNSPRLAKVRYNWATRRQPFRKMWSDHIHLAGRAHQATNLPKSQSLVFSPSDPQAFLSQSSWPRLCGCARVHQVTNRFDDVTSRVCL